QYAGVLQDVLSDPNASKADKMRALTDPSNPRLATLIDALKTSEAADAGPAGAIDSERALGKSFGLTSEALEKTLKDTAANDKDADVRAMAAAMLQGLNEKDPVKRAALLRTNNDLWQEMSGKGDGAYAAKVKESLLKAAQVEVPAAGGRE